MNRDSSSSVDSHNGRVLSPQGLKQTKRWWSVGRVETGTGTETERGHSVLTAGQSLTCMCEATEGPQQGHQEEQLNIHCSEDFLLPWTTPECFTHTHTQRKTQTHTNAPHTPHTSPVSLLQREEATKKGEEWK